MARRSSISTSNTSNTRNNESESGPDHGNDPGSGDRADAASTQGADAGADAGAGTQGAGDGAPPTRPRRKRGPNKPKPGTFDVETKARLRQEEIINLLTAHAITQLGPDVASRMSLQVLVEGACRPLGGVLPPGAKLQFATAQDEE